jgi:ATP/maltotriose-dependent transcriptional regulator MalT
MKLSPKQLEQIKKQYRLSPRETQIVELILQGVESNEDLSKNLGVTLLSAKRYVHDLYGKMGTSTKLSITLKVIDSIHK